MRAGPLTLRLLAFLANLLLRPVVKLSKSLVGNKSENLNKDKSNETVQPVQKSESSIKEKTSPNIRKASSPKNTGELDSALKKSGLSKVVLTDQQKQTLLDKGKVAINGGKQIIQKVSTPAGYAYRAYDMANNMTRQYIAEI